MKDPEFIVFRNRVAIGIAVCIILLTPFFLFFYNKLNQDDSRIIIDIRNQKTFFLYVKDNNSNRSIQREIKKNTKIQVVNIDKSREYPKILSTLETSKTDIEAPALLYIQDGKLIAILNHIEEKENIKPFVENYQGGKE